MSRPDLPWPARKSRRRRKPASELSAEAVKLPTLPAALEAEASSPAGTVEATIPRPETPSTNHAQSEEANSTTPTTPTSINQTSTLAPGDTTPVASKPSKLSTVPAVPIIPALPKATSRDASKQATEKIPYESQSEVPKIEVEENTKENDEQAATNETEVQPPPKAWSTPKLWAGLFNPNASTNAPAVSGSGVGTVSGISKTNSESLAEALRSFDALSTESKLSFLEPRGLVNTGNMCYMNSVSHRSIALLGLV